jgi:hypothetical protein
MDKLNPGIVKTVEWLQARGFQTTDSGDGATHDYECDMPIPYVHMLVEPDKLVSETRRLRDELATIGVVTEPTNETGTAKSIEASFDPHTNLAVLSVFNVRL